MEVVAWYGIFLYGIEWYGMVSYGTVNLSMENDITLLHPRIPRLSPGQN